jgi:hypothetical protein
VAVGVKLGVSVRVGVNVNVYVGVDVEVLVGVAVRVGGSVGMEVSVSATCSAMAVALLSPPEPQEVSSRDITSRNHKAFLFMQLLYSLPNENTTKKRFIALKMEFTYTIGGKPSSKPQGKLADPSGFC